MKAYLNRYLVLLVLSVVLAVVLALFTIDDTEALKFVIRDSVIWVFWFATIVWVVAVSRHALHKWRVARRLGYRYWRSPRWWAVAALVVVGTVLLHIHFEHWFKVMSDEAILLSTSRAMVEENQVLTPNGTSLINGSQKLSGGYMDKRPMYYPFVVSILHSFSGYRVWNPFIVNFLLTPLLLVLVYRVGRQLSDHYGGLLAMLLIMGLPLLGQNVSGAGFEVLNMALLALCLNTAIDLLKFRSAGLLVAVTYIGAVLAYTRYESALYVIPVGFVVAVYWWRRGRLDYPLLVAAVPLVMVPCVWTFRIFMSGPEAFLQLDDTGAHQAFSVQFFYDNLSHALKFLFSPEHFYYNSIVLSAVGTLGILITLSFIALRVRNRNQEEGELRPYHWNELTFFAFAAIVLANFYILLNYHWGQLDDPQVMRLSLPLHLLMALAAAFGTHRLLRRWRYWRYVWLAGIFPIIFVYIPSAAKHHIDDMIYGAHEMQFMYRFRQDTKGMGEYVVVSYMPTGLTGLRMVTATPAYLANNRAQYWKRLQSPEISAIYSQERYIYRPKQGLVPDKPDHFTNFLPKELVREASVHKNLVSRIYRIIPTEEDPHWDKAFKAYIENIRKKDPEMADRMEKAGGMTLEPEQIIEEIKAETRP